MTTELSILQARANQALASALGPIHSEFDAHAGAYLQTLYEASAYALNGGGKRIRPALVYAASEAIDPDSLKHPGLDAVACSVELIHAYSLVHDDLPAMDDDDLRRGQPTVHKQYDEALAILVGDALQARAFELLAKAEGLDADTRLALVLTLAAASGLRGMVGGQAIDVAAADTHIDLAHLLAMHRLKTGALIQASAVMGGLVGGGSQQQQQTLGAFGQAIGLAFQVCDDILDATSDTQTLGKTAGADAAHSKPTYVSLLGLEQAQAKADALYAQAKNALATLGQRAETLDALASYIVSRNY